MRGRKRKRGKEEDKEGRKEDKAKEGKKGRRDRGRKAEIEDLRWWQNLGNPDRCQSGGLKQREEVAAGKTL